MTARRTHRRFRWLGAGLAAGVLATGLAAATPEPRREAQLRMVSGTTPNAVAEWAAIVEPAVHSREAPRSPASAFVVQTIVQLAVYDAVVAVGGGYDPYATKIDQASGADVGAAVATAAYRAARSRAAESRLAYLDERYAAFMATIPDGEPRRRGVEVGEASAAGILKRRAGDGFDQQVDYQCSANPPPAGEFEPDGGCGTQPIDPRLAHVQPFTFDDPSRFRPGPPVAFETEAWAADFAEVKAYGAKDSTVRTPEQTDVAYFWSEHAYLHWNRNLLRLAADQGLDVVQTARFLAMTYTAVTDAAIAGLDAKYAYRLWRPRTAIPRAAEDGNPRTEPDPAWVPLLSVNHPEYPSGHGFVSSALVTAVAAALGTERVKWTIETSKDAVPQLVRTERTYTELNAIPAELDDARVWAGLHYRASMAEGRALGIRVADHVLSENFRPAAR